MTTINHKYCKAITLLFVTICLLTTLMTLPVAAQESTTHTVQRGETLFRIAQHYGVDMNELAALNGITNTWRIDAGQVLIIPGQNNTTPVEEVANPPVAEQEPAVQESATHTVQPGENLFRIGLRYGVDMYELAALNGITDVRHIHSGQVLTIPGLSAPASAEEAEEVVNPLVAGTPTTHVIQRGETLGQIAQLYGITLEQLLQSNNIENPNYVHAGANLTVWTTESVSDVNEIAAEEAATETNTIHTVQRGEHLAQIAAMYGVSWTTIAQVNGIANPDHIYSGLQLLIPLGGTSADQGIIDVPANSGPGATITTGRQIVVDLSDSRAYAYEDGKLVHSALASMGMAATPTVQGDFTIFRKVSSQTMSGPGYYLTGVPWVMYFYQGYSLHGTYWHNNFGTPMSHGCVNLPSNEAAWFYNFASIGTPVHVQW